MALAKWQSFRDLAKRIVKIQVPCSQGNVHVAVFTGVVLFDSNHQTI